MPGNAGTQLIAENVHIDINNFSLLVNFIKLNNIELIIVGPEKPLVSGIVDYLEKHNIKVFGPNKIAAQLEGSKIFTKNLCKKYKIPTANFGVFETKNDSEKFLKNCNFPIVVKADGLAAGKGVYICENYEQSKLSVNEIFGGKFGEAKKILIEEFLKGEEMSFFVISDGQTYKKFGSAQDHKRALEGDKGKNTGGMGAYSPSRLDDNLLNEKILKRIIDPTLKGLNELNTSFKGFLYAGLMIVNGEPYLIEYNVRMGDPETQVVLPRIKNDFMDILISCANQTLDKINLEFDPDYYSNVVLASSGYPEEYKKGFEISGLNEVKDSIIFHAGTSFDNDKTVTNGGRVLSVVSSGKTMSEALNKSYKNIDKINFEGKTFRKDIGFDL